MTQQIARGEIIRISIFADNFQFHLRDYFETMDRCTPSLYTQYQLRDSIVRLYIDIKTYYTTRLNLFEIIYYGVKQKLSQNFLDPDGKNHEKITPQTYNKIRFAIFG